MNNNSKEEEKKGSVAVVNGETVDAKTGEIKEKKDEKPSDEKHIMTEAQAREYVSKLGFKHADIPELYEVMQVPSYSRYEFRMITYIMLWARKNNIDYNIDKKGNIYLTKGKLEEGEFYPCVTSHMDTVQDKAKPYVLAGAELPLKTRRTKSTTTDEVRHEVFVDGQGIGADDKTGVYISLQLMKRFDKIKAAFFVEEEIGMVGSKDLDVSFFDDVAYVVGWDSPDLHRAAWKCSGVRLFSRDLYENHLKKIVEKWGFTDKCFKSEPWTDVISIREKTGIMCMNFGNGGYLAHSTTEYIVIEHVDHAVGMGIDIIEGLGNKQQFKSVKKTYTYNKETNTTEPPVDPESGDDAYLSKLFGEYHSTYGGYSGCYNSGYNGGSSGSSTTKTTTPGTTTNRSDGKLKDDEEVNGVNEETVKYIVETYEEYIKGLKESVDKKCNLIKDALKDKFNEAGIDFSTFGIDLNKEFSEVFSKEISF